MIRSESHLSLKTDGQCLLCVKYTKSLPSLTSVSLSGQCVVCEDSGVYLNIVVLIITFKAKVWTRKSSALSMESAKDFKKYLNFQNSA